MTLVDYINHFNKKHFKRVPPNKWVVWICWLALIVALLIAVINFF